MIKKLLLCLSVCHLLMPLSFSGEYYGGLWKENNKYTFPRDVVLYMDFQTDTDFDTQEIPNAVSTNHFAVKAEGFEVQGGDPVFTKFGKLGGAFDFERDQADFMTVNDATIDDEFVTMSVACWAKIETPFVFSQSHDPISNRGDPGDSGSFLRINPDVGGTATNRLEWIAKDLNNVFTERRYEQVSPTVADLAQLTHYFAAFNGSGSPHTFLINGTASFTTPLNQIPGANYKPVLQQFLIGKQPGGGADTDGVIDEVWIIKRALTTNEGYRIYLDGIVGNAYKTRKPNR